MLKSVETKSWLMAETPHLGVHKSAGISLLAASVFSFSWWQRGGWAVTTATVVHGSWVTLGRGKGRRNRHQTPVLLQSPPSLRGISQN